MSKYMDLLVLPVKRDRVDEWMETAKISAQVWKDVGALATVDSLIEDVVQGEVTSFPMAVKLEEDEVIWICQTYYPSRAARDEMGAKYMADPRIVALEGNTDLPYNGKRSFYSGFEVKIEL
jgi:uncharacterized protein YbaA (DUF1428 family)